MNKPVITAEKLAELYPTSHKIASEKMTPEEYTTFSEEAAEVNARLEAQTAGNQKLKDDLTASNAATKKAEDEAILLRADKIKQEAEIARLKPFEAKVKEITGNGKQLPGEDSNSRETEKPLPANHPNSVALEAWRAANPNAK